MWLWMRMNICDMNFFLIMDAFDKKTWWSGLYFVHSESILVCFDHVCVCIITVLWSWTCMRPPQIWDDWGGSSWCVFFSYTEHLIIILIRVKFFWFRLCLIRSIIEKKTWIFLIRVHDQNWYFSQSRVCFDWGTFD